MPAAHGDEFAPAGFFLLRTPLLPAEAFWRWTLGPEDHRAALLDYVTRPEIREALLVASPSLDDRLETWLADPKRANGQKLESVLARYFARMAMRPTPFGLFAGSTLGFIGDHTRVTLQGTEGHRRHTRLDSDYLEGLVGALMRDPAIRASRRYYLNSSLYRMGSEVRYVEIHGAGRDRSHALASVEVSPALDLVLAAMSSDGYDGEQLVSAIQGADPDVAREEALAFIDALIDAQLLVPDLGIPVTGVEPLHSLIAQLASTAAGTPVARVLSGVRDELLEMDKAVPFRPLRDAYTRLEGKLRALPFDIDRARLFQVDLQIEAAEAVLDQRVVRELVRAAELLALSVPFPENPALAQFRRDFEHRYGGREVPLLEALDEDSGIGFSSTIAQESPPLLSDVLFAQPRSAVRPPWSKFEELLLNKIERLNPGELEIRLTPEELETVRRPEAHPLADSLALIATVAAASPDEIERGNYRVHLVGVEGPSGANWLGRFCQADAQLTSQVKRLTQLEEARRPDAVFAEVVHLPEGRLGNILLRPLLRSYEIPYLGQSGISIERQISTADLLVTVSEGRILLRSKRLGREVVPRLTTAHNFRHERSLTVYRFLGHLQSHDAPFYREWNWGALRHRRFLPRVVCGRVVLALCHWELASERLAGLLRSDSTNDRRRRAQQMRHEMSLPRFVSLADGDNVLPVDFENELSLDSFLQLLKGRTSVRLTEIFPSRGENWVASPSGMKVHDMIIPMLRTGLAPRSVHPFAQRVAAPPGFERTHPPGSEWLFAKIYASPRAVDMALMRIAPTLRRLQAEGIIQTWFFTRYHDPRLDPDWHLRLRLKGDTATLTPNALGELRAWFDSLRSDRLAHRLQLDTYEREVEDWGGPLGIQLAETFFRYDSEAALKILEDCGGEAFEDVRWRLALRSADLVLEDLGLDVPARQRVMRRIRNGLAREFDIKLQFERQMGNRYRREQRQLVELLDDSAQSLQLRRGIQILRGRSTAARPGLRDLSQLERDGGLTRSLEGLAARYVHLCLNRLLRSRHREQELLITDFLGRLYESRIARAATSNQSLGPDSLCGPSQTQSATAE